MARTVAALLAAAVLALLNLGALAGAGYAGVASRHLDQPESPPALAAARIAAQLPPWSAPRNALHGWLLAENGRAEESEAAYRKALRWAPQDALLWTEYALALGRVGRFDAAMTEAITRAHQLAPTSPVVQRSLAEIGLSYWQRGDATQRALWLASMRAELAANRRLFLGHVLTRGQLQAFCVEMAPTLGEDAWCASVPNP